MPTNGSANDAGREGQNLDATPDTDGNGDGDGGANDSSADSGFDAAVDAPVDAPVDAGPSAFAGADPYAATTGPSAREAGHGANPNPAGRGCLNCHGAAGNATRFTFAGTVYRDAAGTMPSAQVEVRAVDQAGKARSVFTDADGNFFLPLAPDGALTFPARVGARNAATTALMNANFMNGNCNGCHKAGTSGRLVVF